jgi:hypothetical protein
MLKYRPKQFWNMIKPARTRTTAIPAAVFSKLNKQLFYDEHIPEEYYTPPVNKEANYITTEEINDILKHKFKANKSSGMSALPLQLLKHMGHEGVKNLTTFLNRSAIDNAPPGAWRETKIVPIYKNKGSTTDPGNYRSLAITPPFAKLFMAVMNSRLTNKARELNLHAPT